MTLSPREREVLTLVVRDGMSDKRIALKLGINFWTVRTHIKRIMLRNPSAKRKRPRAAMADLYRTISSNGDAISRD